MISELLTQNEVAKRLGISEQTLRRYIRRGEIQCIKVGPRFVRIDEEELQRFLDLRKGR